MKIVDLLRRELIVPSLKAETSDERVFVCGARARRLQSVSCLYDPAPSQLVAQTLEPVRPRTANAALPFGADA